MPSYKVLEPGFFGGRLYDPNGKRAVLTVDKAFSKKNMPSWVEPLKGETATQRKKREDAEAKALKDAETAKTEDGAEIEGASFIGGQSAVETL